MTEKLTLVHDIPVKTFANIISKANIDNKHSNLKQFSKGYNNNKISWCMLCNQDKQCLAAASIEVGNGPTNKWTYVNEIQCLKSGHAYGKKLISLLIKKYKFIWLMSNIMVKDDTLLKFYRDPQFNFQEFVISKEKSVYNVDTHFFATKETSSKQTDWMKFLTKLFT